MADGLPASAIREDPLRAPYHHQAGAMPTGGAAARHLRASCRCRWTRVPPTGPPPRSSPPACAGPWQSCQSPLPASPRPSCLGEGAAIVRGRSGAWQATSNSMELGYPARGRAAAGAATAGRPTFPLSVIYPTEQFEAPCPPRVPTCTSLADQPSQGLPARPHVVFQPGSIHLHRNPTAPPHPTADHPATHWSSPCSCLNRSSASAPSKTRGSSQPPMPGHSW